MESESDLIRDQNRELEIKLRQLALHRTDYVSTISHELRTPLTSIRGFAQLLVRDELLPNYSRLFASTVIHEADRLSRIVDDVVDLTKMESTLLELRADPVSLPDILQTIVERMRPSEEPGKLILVLPPQVPAIHGDQARLEQVLSRLVLDAIADSRPGTPIRLTVDVREDTVKIALEYRTILDQTAQMEKNLEGLWQCGADGAATRLGRGELGLYIAKNLIEAHGGHIGVEGPKDGQTRVIIALPY